MFNSSSLTPCNSFRLSVDYAALSQVAAVSQYAWRRAVGRVESSLNGTNAIFGGTATALRGALKRKWKLKAVIFLAHLHGFCCSLFFGRGWWGAKRFICLFTYFSLANRGQRGA